jgi:hypothetical protein
VDPVIDKLLRGESLTAEETAKTDETEDEKGDEVLPPDTNIKDFVAGRAKPTAPKDADDPNIKAAPDRAKSSSSQDADDPNIKTAPAGRDLTPGQVPADLREEVEGELTEGEQLLWAGRPERGAQGRGFLGAITNAAVNKEPEYTLFALTNRRVLIWAKRGTRVANQRSWGGDVRGPLSYYPPALRNAGLEEDKRIPDGGNIIFKKVRVKIVTQVTENSTTRRGNKVYVGKKTREKVSYEMHSFGILHIRNYRAVARLLHATLLAPLRVK